MNKRYQKPTEPDADSLRENAARQLKDSEEAAKEVAVLCARAAEKARSLHLPHAGVGSTTDSRD